MKSMHPAAFRLAEARQVLARTPAILEVMLLGIDRAWVEADEGPETWNPRVVVGHLIHGEKTDWIPRAKIILAGDETATFVPFDRFAQIRDWGRTPLPELLPIFARLRAENLATLDSLQLTEQHLSKRARHPDFGPVTLRELLATWVVHDLGHIAQIARVMAKRYDEDVGPWKAYLPVLRDHRSASRG
jgi:hypothetical protein